MIEIVAKIMETGRPGIVITDEITPVSRTEHYIVTRGNRLFWKSTIRDRRTGAPMAFDRGFSEMREEQIQKYRRAILAECQRI